MQSITLPTQPRETGKKAAKATRREGLVPCVLYSRTTEPVHFSVESLALRPLIFTTETRTVDMTLGGEDYNAIVKDITFHPVSEQPLHVDFLALTAGEALTMSVPIQLEGDAPGVKAGGLLSQPLFELEIRSLPKNIPGHVSIDISALDMGESLHVENIILGDEIEVLTDPHRTVVTIVAPRAVVDETDEGEEGLEGDAEAVADADAAASEETPDAE
ncbi:MAG: 50S ribosomal protein L25 [Bacteroidota bacterium]